MGEIGGWMFQFIVLGISLAAPVGPIKLEMIKRGLRRGFWHSWLVGLGAVTADSFFMFCIFTGLTPFLKIGFVQIGMLSIGMLMLLFLGTTTIKGAAAQKKLLVIDGTTAQAPYWTGFILALMNPFNFVFWFGVYGGALQSLPDHYEIYMNGFLSCFILVGIVLWNLNIAFTVHFFRAIINEKIIRWLMVIAGFGLLGFAANLGIKLVNLLS
ncbi:LysE family transporter [Fictibacillus barbaricus]|uniref:Threonine/homoserine/homoserine lactone efflux protein n=1 Tax=Fictibacillus barbaricus TaxID=182136 RepID=A0ABU1TX74_9BACL|nr:LysE family transporter [Fictibacillus barbaricus]MDR7071802.1 threonine/homoserine/homoserine lactone efflux protein [Fictibacillus barbaricus]